MDRASHQIFYVAGFDFAEAARTTPFLGCPLVSNSAVFRKPALYNDLIVITSEIGEFRDTSFTMRHVFTRDEELLAEGQEVRVWGWSDEARGNALDTIPVPEEIRALFTADVTRDVTP